ncbi:MAG: SRPBCC domain-containing protein [Micropruina sp.]|uniref:SRPBCC domain-containing protein n=1 Tax=Micropruina sp. TaxID=2737536 RepID=UPI0039E29845
MTDTPQAPRDEAIAAQVHAPIEVDLELEEDQWTIVMRRRFPHAPQKLWAMLTEPARLARWSPIVPDRPLTEPGPASCRENSGDDPIDAEVLVVDAPRQLVHRWGPDLLRWTLTPDGEGTALELRQATGGHGAAVMLVAGWQVCLGRLAAEDGADRERPTGQRAMAYGWEELRDKYRDQFSERIGTQEGSMSTAFRGVFLTSTDPAATARFYRDIAGFPLEQAGEGGYNYWRLDRDGMQFAIHDAQAFASYAYPPNRDSNLAHLYFRVADRDAFIAHLHDLDVQPFAVDDVVVTVVDPDGRKVMFGTA